MKVSDFSKNGLSSLPGPSGSHFQVIQSVLLRIPRHLLKSDCVPALNGPKLEERLLPVLQGDIHSLQLCS